MMPSLKRKQELANKSKRMNLFMRKGFPKGIMVEIGLYLCSDRFKVALNYMRTCKTIYEQCNKSPRFWYFLFVLKYPKEFLDQYYIPIVGESSGLPDKYATNSQILEYLRPKFEILFDFEPQLKSISWKELFLQKTVTTELQNQKNNMKMFKKVYIDSWKKQNIRSLISKLDLQFQVVVNSEVKFMISTNKKQIQFGGATKN